MASLVRVYCLYCKAPGWAPEAEGLLRLFYNLTSWLKHAGVKSGASLSPSLSFSLQHVFLKLPILERAGHASLNYLLLVVVVVVEPSSCFLCLIFTHTRARVSMR